MKPEIKDKKQEIKKPTLLTKIKKLFIPKEKEPEQITAIKIVKEMSKNNPYPVGKSIDKISKYITNEKELPVAQRLELLLDAYGKYYKYQHQSTVSYAVDEEAADFSRIEDEYYRMGKKISFNDYFNARMKEQEYIVNRELRNNAQKLLTNAENNGNKEEVMNNLDSYGALIINNSLKLQDDFWTNRDKSGYKFSNDEKFIKDALIYRYEQKLEAKKSKTTQCPSQQKSEDKKQSSDSAQGM